MKFILGLAVLVLLTAVAWEILSRLTDQSTLDEDNGSNSDTTD